MQTIANIIWTIANILEPLQILFEPLQIYLNRYKYFLTITTIIWRLQIWFNGYTKYLYQNHITVRRTKDKDIIILLRTYAS